MNEQTINRIISAAYGSSGFVERLRVRRIIKKDPEAKRIYNSYRRTAVKVHSLGNVVCPDIIVKKAGIKSNLYESGRNGLLRPVAAFAIVILAVVIAVFSLLKNPQKEYTAEEVKTAEIQATGSLAYIGKILNRTTETLSNEILPQKVSKPVKKGLNIINDLLIGG